MNDNLNLKEMFARLAAPFNPEDIEWRAGVTNAEKTKALALAYITSRAVMDRLDEVIGPENWRDEYNHGPDGGVICGLSLRINNEWITKWDGAENTDFEAIKGGLSDAFKRAGYKWGIGRYLYKLESVWVPCEAHGKSIVLKSTPKLPAWALPTGQKTPSGQSEREKEILSELGFETRPQPVTVSQPVAPISPGPNGNGQKPKPEATRRISWSSGVVMAVVNSHLAANASEAVKLLNQTDLPSNTTTEQAVEAVKKLKS